MTPDAEIVIVGAGCAGLSLAAALALERVPGRVLLLEPRTVYTRDRTWCFWNTEEHPFTSAVSHSWNAWGVSANGRAVLRQSRRYRYCHIAGDRFYRDAVERVDRAPEQQLCRGVSVRSIAREANGLQAVETDQGRLLARQVFDSRPAAGDQASQPAFLQRFLGRHVRTAQACFDPEAVELMRFLPSDVPGRIRFLYLLPFSATEALVEMTYLDAPTLPPPAYDRELDAWLRQQTDDWEVLYTEQGSLPMSVARIDAGEAGVIPIGVRGGRLKPSSGYGFLRIQRHSRALARAMRLGAPLLGTAEPGVYSAMDAVFLQALQSRPDAASELFLRMFARSDPDALVRFLSEGSAGPGEILRVAWSLPKGPMLRAMAAALNGKARSGARR